VATATRVAPSLSDEKQEHEPECCERHGSCEGTERGLHLNRHF
jgi:hypothetical protein